MIRRALRRLRREDAGLGLTELLISAMLTIVILVMVAALFVQTAKITANATQTNDSNGVASNVANEITSVVRVATTLAVSGQVPSAAIVEGTRSSLKLYSLSNTDAANPAPVMITFTRDNTTQAVTETRCTAVASGSFWTFGTCATSKTRTLGIGVLPPTGVADQLFTYYDANDQPMLIGTGNLGATQKPLVAKIKIQVIAQAPDSDTDPVRIENTVVLGNLGLDPVS